MFAHWQLFHTAGTQPVQCSQISLSSSPSLSNQHEHGHNELLNILAVGTWTVDHLDLYTALSLRLIELLTGGGPIICPIAPRTNLPRI